MKKFVSFLVILFMGLNPWNISPESAHAIVDVTTTLAIPAFAGVGLLILAWEWLEEAYESRKEL